MQTFQQATYKWLALVATDKENEVVMFDFTGGLFLLSFLLSFLFQ